VTDAGRISRLLLSPPLEGKGVSSLLHVQNKNPGDGAATEPPRVERPVMHDSRASHVDATLQASGLPPSHASVQEGWLEGTALHAQPTGCRGVHQPFPIGPGVRGVASSGFHVVGGQRGRRKQFLPAGCPGREPSAPLPRHTGAQSGAGRVPVSARDHNPLACSSSLCPARPACFREEREEGEHIPQGGDCQSFNSSSSSRLAACVFHRGGGAAGQFARLPSGSHELALPRLPPHLQSCPAPTPTANVAALRLVANPFPISSFPWTCRGSPLP
jgi:hypothetical protein